MSAELEGESFTNRYGWDQFKHYGIKRKSGRYPWGSGNDPYQRSMTFYAYVNDLKGQGISDKEIAQAIGLFANDGGGYSVADLRDTRTIAKEIIVLEQTQRCVALREKEWSIDAISKETGLPAPTVRLRLKNSENHKQSSLSNTADVLRKNVDEHDIVDIGKGVNHHLGISPERLRAAASVLRDEGYETYTLPVKNVGTSHFTNQQVMVKPGTGFGDARRMTDRIHTMGDYTEDDGISYLNMHPILNVNPKRLQVKFDEDGGSLEDGVVYVRRDAPGLDMGKNTYAQVRIGVGGTHFIKGMAVVKDPADMPDGVDLVFNTNKKRGTPIMGDSNNSVLKLQKDDPANPFGSSIKRQIIEADPKTGEQRVKSAMNFVNEEGDWNWRESLPSQMLAKQPQSLIKSQLDVTREQTKARLDEINSITNPIVRRKKLEDFADQVDADAVDLRAASLAGQKTQVIIPMPKMRKGEIYAPQFKTGEKVVLIRYPHGGRFEIPEVTVNNNNRTAKKLLGNAVDAIGIHPSVAERLSGADFDGDTVVVIPNRSGTIKGVDSLRGGEKAYYQEQFDNFNPKVKYGGYEVVGKNAKGEDIGNFTLMKNTGLEMGMITNLITDMQVQGARAEHVVRAVRHSMVVIDAEKHKLDYKQSAKDNNIAQLKEEYQGSAKSGAKTLLSRATAEDRIDKRKLRPAKDGGAVDKDTGKLVYVPSGKTTNLYDKKTKTYMDGKEGRPLIKVPVQEKVKRLALTDDANTLVRDPRDPVERLYADHANGMKDIANVARLQATRIPNPLQNKAAKEVYKEEIEKLVSDLKKAEAQKPLDRRADVIAGKTVKMLRDEDPLLRTDTDRLKKVERQAKAAARARLGLEKPVIDISDKQWDAIQSGGISAKRLSDILEYADPKRVETLSLPRKNTVMTTAVSARAKAMMAAGVTTADIAAALGIPSSTLREAIRRGDL